MTKQGSLAVVVVITRLLIRWWLALVAGSGHCGWVSHGIRCHVRMRSHSGVSPPQPGGWTTGYKGTGGGGLWRMCQWFLSSLRNRVSWV